MPAKKKIDKEMILEASLSILRGEGYSALNVRRIAKELKCSTQPIYYIFGNMETLLAEIKAEAEKVHHKYVSKYLEDEKYRNYPSYGLGFVRFATEEKELFRYLYLYEEKGGKKVDDIHLEAIYELIQKEYGYSREISEKFHSQMSFYSYGLAMMMNTGYIKLSDEEISENLNTEFMALISVFGPPPAFIGKKIGD